MGAVVVLTGLFFVSKGKFCPLDCPLKFQSIRNGVPKVHFDTLKR